MSKPETKSEALQRLNDGINFEAARLTEVLRVWIRSRQEPDEAIAAAMAYELAALVALHADTVPQAFDLLDAWVDGMKDQIRIYGIGVDHP